MIGKITGSLSFLELESQAAALGPWVSVVVLLLFWGAAGKSAQFPLHIWLPDAMEGPTPVSALIHAATMVAAGVYLVARTMPLFVQSPEALLTVAIVGGLTSLFAATIACTQTDLKKILAYSTISQLGFMMLGLGCGLAWVGMFHLVTHAVFKALLFLGAGSVIFAMHHEQDVRKMGGLIRRMPVTGITFILGAVAMAGVPPFSGFWSKEGILTAIHSALPVPFLVLALMISFLTAFYISRAVILTFFGRPTEVPDAEESPWVMTIPLMLLGAGAMGVGLLGSPWMHEAFQHFLGAKVHHDAHAAWLAPVSIAVAFSGIGLAWIQYQRGLFLLPEKTRASFRPLVELAAHKYYIDEMVEAALLRPVRNLAQKAFSFDASVVDGAVNGAGRLGLWLSRWKGRFDAVVVDGAVNGTANTVGWAGGLLRKLQTGLVQNYLLLATAGAVAIFLMARGLS